MCAHALVCVFGARARVCVFERAHAREGGRERASLRCAPVSFAFSPSCALALSFALLSTVPIVQEKLKPTTVSVEKPVETVQQTVKPVEVIKEVPITTQVRTCSFLSIAHLLTLSPPDHSFLGVFLHPPFSFAYSCWS
jgi:hypothetical protein